MSAPIIFGAANVNALVTGVRAEYLTAFNLEVAQGRFVEASGVDKRAEVAILGYQAARLNPIEALRYE